MDPPLPLQNRVIGYILLLRKKVVLKNKQDYLSELAINGRESDYDSTIINSCFKYLLNIYYGYAHLPDTGGY